MVPIKSIAAALLLTTSLSGCAIAWTLWDAYSLAPYDTNEYALVNKIRTQSEVAVNDCKDQTKSQTNFDTIYNFSLELKNFSQYIPKNKDTQKLTVNLYDLSKQGKEAYGKGNVSEVFCKLKLQQVNRTAETIQTLVGKRPK